jgi:hypothetical protein
MSSETSVPQRPTQCHIPEHGILHSHHLEILSYNFNLHYSYFDVCACCLQITFRVDEVIVPDVPGMFTSFQVKGSPLFVDPRLFVDPEHYARIMGYDKPIDFKLTDVSAENMKPSGKKHTA